MFMRVVADSLGLKLLKCRSNKYVSLKKKVYWDESNIPYFTVGRESFKLVGPNDTNALISIFTVEKFPHHKLNGRVTKSIKDKASIGLRQWFPKYGSRPKHGSHRVEKWVAPR
ncbi:uncharacterized protein LOC144746219 [Ciona intestinalis]